MKVSKYKIYTDIKIEKKNKRQKILQQSQQDAKAIKLKKKAQD